VKTGAGKLTAERGLTLLALLALGVGAVAVFLHALEAVEDRQHVGERLPASRLGNCHDRLPGEQLRQRARLDVGERGELARRQRGLDGSEERKLGEGGRHGRPRGVNRGAILGSTSRRRETVERRRERRRDRHSVEVYVSR
jgi:hypothetical protein